jgi:hypothetical protein
VCDGHSHDWARSAVGIGVISEDGESIITPEGGIAAAVIICRKAGGVEDKHQAEGYQTANHHNRQAIVQRGICRSHLEASFKA